MDADKLSAAKAAVGRIADAGRLRMVLRGGQRHGGRLLRVRDGRLVRGRRHRTMTHAARWAMYRHQRRTEHGKPWRLNHEQ